VLKHFVAKVETQLEQRVKIFQTDQGREYLPDMFKHFCEGKGIQWKLMILRTPQQNGVAERKNKHRLTWLGQ